nr:MAG TPA: hypothetical protein [Caudoviricetes sp.]
MSPYGTNQLLGLKHSGFVGAIVGKKCWLGMEN